MKGCRSVLLTGAGAPTKGSAGQPWLQEPSGKPPWATAGLAQSYAGAARPAQLLVKERHITFWNLSQVVRYYKKLPFINEGGSELQVWREFCTAALSGDGAQISPRGAWHKFSQECLRRSHSALCTAIAALPVVCCAAAKSHHTLLLSQQ